MKVARTPGFFIVPDYWTPGDCADCPAAVFCGFSTSTAEVMENFEIDDLHSCLIFNEPEKVVHTPIYKCIHGFKPETCQHFITLEDES